MSCYELHCIVCCCTFSESLSSPNLPSGPAQTEVGANSTGKKLLSGCRTALMLCVCVWVCVFVVRAMDANAIIQGLRHANFTVGGIVTMVTLNPDAKQQNEFFHEHLYRTCDEKPLTEACDILTSVQGNRKMETLRRDIYPLGKGICLVCVSVYVYVRVCMHAC